MKQSEELNKNKNKNRRKPKQNKSNNESLRNVFLFVVLFFFFFSPGTGSLLKPRLHGLDPVSLLASNSNIVTKIGSKQFNSEIVLSI